MRSPTDGDIRLDPLTAQHAAAMDELAREEDVARFAANPASEMVAQRCGYTREGVLRWTYLKPGLRSDTIVYSMLRREHA